MSAALISMAGQSTNASGARRLSDLSVSGMCAYGWSTGNATVAATAIAPIPVFADTKRHARRLKEASQ